MSQSNGNAAHRRVLVGLSALAVLGFFIATLVDLDPSSRVLSAANALTFTEIASTAGVTAPADSNGSSVVDVDGDGLEDLVLRGANTITLYRSNGDGTFSDATASWPGLSPSGGTLYSTFWADFDNDGDADVALAMGSPLELRFLRNNRIGTAEQSFTQISSLAGHAPLASWADFDNDGDLDVYVGTHSNTGGGDKLLRNNLKESGTVSFTDVSTSVGLLSSDSVTFGVHWTDADNDGDMDLFVTNYFRNATLTRDLFYRNLLKETDSATFEEVTGAVGFHTGSIPSTNSMFGDYDDDGDQDLYVGLGHFTANLLYRNNLEGGSLSFTEVGGSLDVQEPSDGGISVWGDLDNDGDLDILAGDPSNQWWVLHQNQLVETGSVGFTGVNSAVGLSPGDHQSALLFFDMENDGDLDIFSGFNGGGSNRLFRNDLSGGKWLDLKLVGVDSNRDGIGARITLVAGGRTQYRQHTVYNSIKSGNLSRRIHFGLDSATTVDQLTIDWPSGQTQFLYNIASNQVLEVTEPAKTLWAWGEGDGPGTNTNTPTQEPSGSNTWSSIAAGSYYTVALKSDGTLWAWG